MKFDWDSHKSKINIQKHGVSFEEAQSVFFDEEALLIHDTMHSAREERFLILGMSSKVRTLVVCHCYRDKLDVIRIISARKANKLEQKTYIRRVLR
jgi:uncharacterized protein